MNIYLCLIKEINVYIVHKVTFIFVLKKWISSLQICKVHFVYTKIKLKVYVLSCISLSTYIRNCWTDIVLWVYYISVLGRIFLWSYRAKKKKNSQNANRNNWFYKKKCHSYKKLNVDCILNFNFKYLWLRGKLCKE